MEKSSRRAYVDPGGVEGAFVCDAGRAVILPRKLAVCKQVAAFVDDGLHHCNQQANDAGDGQEARQEAEDQQHPLLRGHNTTGR